MISKRLFDLLFSLVGLIMLAPVFAFISVWIQFDNLGPVFFRQIRVGRFGRHFNVLKFRTMVVDAESKGGKITVGDDPRITRIGKFLRKYKLDELPQLLNVIKGEMSLVGPRPEVPKYVEFYPEKVKEIVFSIPPGITDFASLEFRNENELLSASLDPNKEYLENILPIKLEHYQRYVLERSLLKDCFLILRTILVLIKKR